MSTITLSEAALALLLRHGEHGELPVDDSNRELHRELAHHGLMVAVHTFSGGRGRFSGLRGKGGISLAQQTRIDDDSGGDAAACLFVGIKNTPPRLARPRVICADLSSGFAHFSGIVRVYVDA